MSLPAPTPDLKTFLRPFTTSYRTLLCIGIAGPQNQFVIICRHESHCPRTRWKVNISPVFFLFISYRIPIVKLKFGWFTGYRIPYDHSTYNYKLESIQVKIFNLSNAPSLESGNGLKTKKKIDNYYLISGSIFRSCWYVLWRKTSQIRFRMSGRLYRDCKYASQHNLNPIFKESRCWLNRCMVWYNILKTCI